MPIYEELYQRLSQRDILANWMVEENNRLHARGHRTISIPVVQERAAASSHFMKEQVKQIDKELLDLLENGAWAENARRLLFIKSIGVVTAGWLLVATVNFTNCDTVEQLCSFAGIVPRQRQSGTSLQRRPNIGYAAHARLRRALFIATYSAVQHNPPIRRLLPALAGAGEGGQVSVGRGGAQARRSPSGACGRYAALA